MSAQEPRYASVRYRIEIEPGDLASVLPGLAEDISFNVSLDRQIARLYQGTQRDTAPEPHGPRSSFRALSEREIELLVEIPYPAAGPDIPYILSIVFGNLIRAGAFRRLQVVEVNLGENSTHGAGGPIFGVEGLREFLGEEHRPLLSVPLVAQPDDIPGAVDRCTELAGAGVNLLPDSPLRVYGSLDAARGYANDVIHELARRSTRAIVFLNSNSAVMGGTRAFAALAQLQEELGWPVGVRLDPFAVGFPALLEARHHGLVVLSYSQIGRLLGGGGVGIPTIAQLTSAMGADVIATGGGDPATFERASEVRSLVSLLLFGASAASRRRTLPMITGGVRPREAYRISREMPADIAIHVARGILEGPLPRVDNVRAHIEAIELGVRGQDYDSAVQERDRKVRHITRYETALGRGDEKGR